MAEEDEAGGSREPEGADMVIEAGEDPEPVIFWSTLVIGRYGVILGPLSPDLSVELAADRVVAVAVEPPCLFALASSARCLLNALTR